MRTFLLHAKPQLALCTALLLAHSSFGYDQATTGTYAAGTLNPIAKDATTSPNDSATFISGVATAFAADSGGIFDLPGPGSIGTAVASYRGTYGINQAKRLTITTSTTMQNITTSGTSFGILSPPNGTTSSTDTPGYTLTIGTPVDATSGAQLLEGVVQIGFTVLSRNNALYPIDVRVTASFSDASTQIVTTNLARLSGGDNTFFGFTAPSGATITSVALAALNPTTGAPVSTRIGWDDFGFITASMVPPPEVRSVSPFNYAITNASSGVAFTAHSYLAIPATGISLKLNSIDVSSQLVIGGTDTDTNRTVSFSALQANQTYDMLITVTNSAGVGSASYRFYTHEHSFPIFDSGGFSDTGLYPLGPLTAVSSTGCTWSPPASAAAIEDSGEPQYGHVLRETMGYNQITYLQIPPVASGILKVAFDARASDSSARTLDLGINATIISRQGTFLGWGTVSGQLAYGSGSTWVGLIGVDNAWHHYELLNYLSGANANTFDLWMDGTLVASNLPFKTTLDSQSPIGYLRLGATGSLGSADVDNLQLSAGPLAVPVNAVTLTSVSISGSSFAFSFQSQAGITHTVERSLTAEGGWGDWYTIPGDGTIKTVTDTNTLGVQFYRVRSQ